MHEKDGARNAGEHRDPERPGQTPELDAERLMAGGREVVIIHNGERYRLRITSKQRLILTK